MPSEIRRNLGHIKSLDKSYKALVDELREREEEYLRRAQEIISSLPVQSVEEHVKKRQKVSESSSSTAVETEDSPPTESEQLTTTTTSASSFSYRLQHKYGIPVPSATIEDNPSSTETSNDTTATPTTLYVPTTEELRSKIHDRAALVAIARLRRDVKRYSEEKILVADQTLAVVNGAVKTLKVDLEKFETALKGSGCFETSPGAQPDDLAAIQVLPNSPDWILAKVISHDTKTGMFKLSDEDIESNKTFTLPESQVVILGGVDRLSKSDTIYAVYPDTTSFYQATVVQAPRKNAAGGDAFVTVHFKDDGDENGITHDKAVLMKHVMRVPYGAIQ